MQYDWPGNVRQLENLIKRMVVLGSEAPIVKELQQPAMTPLQFRPSAVSMAPPPLQRAQPAYAQPSDAAFPSGVMPRPAPKPEAAATPAVVATGVVPLGSCSLKDIARSAAREAERELILRMLTRTRWNRKQAAEILGISYKALLYKIKENGLDKAS